MQNKVGNKMKTIENVQQKIKQKKFISGALPMVTATVYCLSGPLKWLIILFYCVLCLWGLHKVIKTNFKLQFYQCNVHL